MILNYLIKKEYDYAVRICAFLAGQEKEKPISVTKIAKKMNVTRSYTTKIVYILTKKEILKSVQGKLGGIYLNTDPDKLSVFDILTAMGFTAALNDCLIEGHHCPLSDRCKIQYFFAEQEHVLFNSFKKKMISELAF